MSVSAPFTPTNKKRALRVNHQIDALSVRLIDPKGLFVGPDGQPDLKRTGVMPLSQALRLAEGQNKDLVEISPQAQPPVVCVMDFDKFLFDEKKNRKRQKVLKIKEIKLRPVTDEGDYQIKLRNLSGFLEKGHKVKITFRFRGREITHQELAVELIDRLKQDILAIGTIEQMPRLEGRQMVMILAPKRTEPPLVKGA